jgi:hypothetical protein
MAPQLRPTVSLFRRRETIVREAISVLSQTGVLVENHEGQVLLKEGGASEAGGRFRIPEAMARNARGQFELGPWLLGALARVVGSTVVSRDPATLRCRDRLALAVGAIDP